MKLIVFDFPQASLLGKSIRKKIGGTAGKILIRSFPDGETYLRIKNNVEDSEVIIDASLFHPNPWILNLIFLANTLRRQGAKRVGLLAPYLAYMRQDKIFHAGEALTSVTFAKLISDSFDYLVTVDPHLHRYHNLNEIYSIPTYVVRAAPLLSNWIHTHVKTPFIIGPDSESLQWVKEIAKESPYIVLTKVRHENGHVDITWPTLPDMENKTPVLVDDIISSGVTMLQAIHYLKKQKTKPPFCIAIHPVFANNSYEQIRKAGVQDIVTCNTISHPSNQIDLTPLLAEVMERILS